MKITMQLSKHLGDVFEGDNWTCSDVKSVLGDVTVEEALRKKDGFNTIARLSYHIIYYVRAITDVLEGRALTSNDKLSFDHPPFPDEAAWRKFVSEMLQDAAQLSKRIAALPDEQLDASFFEAKYGNYYRNLAGLIEHTHYHLGQIVILKKLHRQGSNRSISI